MVSRPLTRSLLKLAPPVGIEPTTCALTVRRSTTELQGNLSEIHTYTGDLSVFVKITVISCIVNCLFDEEPLSK